MFWNMYILTKQMMAVILSLCEILYAQHILTHYMREGELNSISLTLSSHPSAAAWLEASLSPAERWVFSGTASVYLAAVLIAESKKRKF